MCHIETARRHTFCHTDTVQRREARSVSHFHRTKDEDTICVILTPSRAWIYALCYTDNVKRKETHSVSHRQRTEEGDRLCTILTPYLKR